MSCVSVPDNLFSMGYAEIFPNLSTKQSIAMNPNNLPMFIVTNLLRQSHYKCLLKTELNSVSAMHGDSKYPLLQYICKAWQCILFCLPLVIR